MQAADSDHLDSSTLLQIDKLILWNVIMHGIAGPTDSS